MDTDVLAQKLAAGLPSAITLARSLGPAARPIAHAVLGSPDAQVRTIAVHCLRAAGDPSDLPAIASMLRDPSADVRGAATVAIRELHRGAAGHGALILESFDAMPTPALRSELALALGERLDPPIGDLESRFRDEANREVQDALRAALARRGSLPAIHELSDLITSASGDVKKAAMNAAAYTGRRELLPALRRALDDGEELERGSPCYPPRDFVQRGRDLAAWSISEITGASFGFAERGFSELTPENLDEVRRTVDEILGGRA